MANASALRASRALLPICALLTIAGCGKKEPEVVTPKQPLKAHTNWPDDTIVKPEFLSVVDRQAGRVPGDAEAARVASTYKIPDWAEPTSTVSVRGPKGAKLAFHLLPRTEPLRSQDEAHIAGLLKGKKQAAETLVVARPWIGWYGQASGVEPLPDNKQRATAIRVYNLFQDKLQLEIHLEWPSGHRDAFEEAQDLLANVVYSVEPLGTAKQS